MSEKSASEIFDLSIRPRRNRKTHGIRSLLQENSLLPQHLIAPMFVVDGQKQIQTIASMPEVFRFSIDELIKEASELFELGIKAVNLFTYIPQDKKNAQGTEALRPGNLLQKTIKALKQEIPDLCLMCDIALDPYTDHGHDGLLNSKGDDVDNDLTLDILAKMALLAADAGVDVISPSDMMDGRVGYLRKALDKASFSDVSILSYTAKYASAFYGPYRDALNSAPKGNKKTYQMNPANSREAMRECLLDISEGADMLLVKPALPYLDVLAKMKESTCLPIGAYQVSGEYAMIHAAHEKGWVDKDRVFEESLLSIRRAGADFILTYAAKRMAQQLKTRKF